MSVYSPTTAQEQFSMPESIATEAQANTTLQSAVSDPQGAKYFSDSESYSNSEATGSYYSPSTTRPYSYSHSSVSPGLLSPSTYPSAYNATYTGTTDGVMPGYTSVCMSPSYMSPYGPKHYTWPPTVTNGMNYSGYSPELMQTATYPYQPSAAAYSQMAMTRSTYPTAGYLPPQLVSTTTSQSC